MQRNISDFRATQMDISGPDGTDLPFKQTREILGKEIEIWNVCEYINRDGQSGVIVKFASGNENYYTYSKSIGIVQTLTSDAVKDAIAAGDTITARIVERPSKKTPGQRVYALE